MVWEPPPKRAPWPREDDSCTDAVDGWGIYQNGSNVWWVVLAASLSLLFALVRGKLDHVFDRLGL